MIESGRPPLGAVGPHIYEAPPADGGSSSGGNRRRFRLSRLVSSRSELDPSIVGDPEDQGELPIEETLPGEEEFDELPDQRTPSGEEEMSISDSERVIEGVDEFMQGLYGSYRYAAHNDRILAYREHYTTRDDTSEDEHATNEVERMAIVLHDFVDKAILNPEDTVRKLGLPEDQASDLKSSALKRFNELVSKVDDTDGLIKAFLFAIDASKWEVGARVWRGGATNRVDEMVTLGTPDKKTGEMVKMDERTGEIVKAAINKTAMPEGVDEDEIERALRTPGSLLRDLKLGEISDATLDHNVKGLFLKGLETLDNIVNPPKDNLPSTYRDCTEAINFFVPALMAHGYKELANDLNGAALKWFYRDPEGHAARQHAAARHHYPGLRDIVVGLREKKFSYTGEHTESRVKTEGSDRQKLAEDKYKDLELVPDGVGFAFVVPNDMSPEAIETFALSYRNRLTEAENIVVGHPTNDPDEAYENTKRDSGYHAIHMTFYYYPEDGSGPVPFEIQVLTEEQNEMKLYGEYSDLFYKAGTEFTPGDRPYLDHLARRGQAEREMAPASTIQSLAEMIAISPEIAISSEDEEIPSIFNKLFRAVDTASGQRILVPTILEQLARENAGMLERILGETGDLTVLPPTKVTEGQFIEALGMFGRDLARDGKIIDKNILDALNMVRASEAGKKRKDRVTSVLEGHLLPTALSALMLAIQSGKIWDSKELGPTEYMSNIVTTAILHDYVEDTLKEYQDNIPAMLQKREAMLADINSQFGITIRNGVAALTSPTEIVHDDTRRKQYAQNVQANNLARIIKPADRWQNHVTDLVKLTYLQTLLDPTIEEKELYDRIMEYFQKTDDYQSAGFTSEELPKVYPRVHDIIWRFARHFGYEGTPANN